MALPWPVRKPGTVPYKPTTLNKGFFLKLLLFVHHNTLIISNTFIHFTKHLLHFRRGEFGELLFSRSLYHAHFKNISLSESSLVFCYTLLGILFGVANNCPEFSSLRLSNLFFNGNSSNTELSQLEWQFEQVSVNLLFVSGLLSLN
jgi:hypothetical protein